MLYGIYGIIQNFGAPSSCPQVLDCYPHCGNKLLLRSGERLRPERSPEQHRADTYPLHLAWTYNARAVPKHRRLANADQRRRISDIYYQAIASEFDDRNYGQLRHERHGRSRDTLLVRRFVWSSCDSGGSKLGERQHKRSHNKSDRWK